MKTYEAYLLPGADRGPLGRREAEAACLYARGLRICDVACAMGVSASTASKHLENIRNKLGADSTVHAVSIAIAHGFIVATPAKEDV